MDAFLDRHFQALIDMDAEAVASGYSQALVGIVNLNGKSQTVRFAGAAKLMRELLTPERFGAGDGVQTLLRRGTKDFGVLALSCRGFTPLFSYTCVVKEGAITRMTLYAYRPSGPLPAPRAEPLSRAKMARALFRKHALAMVSRSADVIVKDYAEDAVVIANLSDHLCDGKPEIHAFCGELMQSWGKIVKGFRLRGFPVVRWKAKDADADLLLFVCEVKALNLFMTETYLVAEGKIRFEASIFGGDMPQILNR